MLELSFKLHKSEFGSQIMIVSESKHSEITVQAIKYFDKIARRNFMSKCTLVKLAE